MSTVTQPAMGMVYRLIESSAQELGVGPLTTIARDELLAYIGDLERERDDGEDDPVGDGPFHVLPRGVTGDRYDVVRVAPVGTSTDQARTIIAESVAGTTARTVAGMLNALARTGALGG